MNASRNDAAPRTSREIATIFGCDNFLSQMGEFSATCLVDGASDPFPAPDRHIGPGIARGRRQNRLGTETASGYTIDFYHTCPAILKATARLCHIEQTPIALRRDAPAPDTPNAIGETARTVLNFSYLSLFGFRRPRRDNASTGCGACQNRQMKKDIITSRAMTFRPCGDVSGAPGNKGIWCAR